MTDDALDLEMRRRIYDALQAYPGLHVRELARHLDTSAALVDYHLAPLSEAGLVAVEEDDRYHRLYALGGRSPRLDVRERQWVGALREPARLAIALHLASRPMRHGELSEATGQPKSSLSFHLSKLAGAGVVVKGDDGHFALADVKAVTRLLVTHKPTRPLRDRFADLWLGFYGD